MTTLALRCLRSTAVALVIVLAVMLTGSAIAAAQEPTPDDAARTDSAQTTACDTAGDVVGDVLGTQLPVIGDLIGGASGALCAADGNPLDAAKNFATSQFAEMWESQFGEIVQSILTGMAQVLTMAMTWWIKIPNPDLQNFTPLQTISEYTGWIQLALLVATIIFLALRLAAARRHALLNEAEETYKALSRTVIAATMFSVVVAAGTRAGDAFSDWLITDTSNRDPVGMVDSMLSINSYGSATPGLMLIIGLVGLLGAIAQAVMLVARQVLLIAAVAAAPLAAAAGGTSVGSQSYDKIVAWIIAFLLFKPVGALVYAMAFLTAQNSANVTEGEIPDIDQLQQSLLGIVMLTMAAAVLPAMMRLLVPAVAAVGSGGSGAAAAGTALMAGAAVATGGKSMAAGKAVGGGSAGAAAFSGGAGGVGRLAGGGGGGAGGGGGGGGGGGSRPSPRPNLPPPSPGGSPSSASGRQSQSANGSRGGSGGGSGSKAAKAVGSGAAGAGRSADDLAGGRTSNNSSSGNRHAIPR
ncbi:hypothetical protein [Rhodococcus sp. 14-1411-2a]|uniref:hypothetical protein n=1 Tax=Rhodococcus sp. 14-1411-2a TaxID=2023151 RepID=UPI000B9A6ECC|nr:hypothetical protein [Rhodococcus sp. 14-1411-2a]OZF42488.1 hypothetical protein CH291_26225 [Rhodococcus sp. 14-1411-2a]